MSSVTHGFLRFFRGTAPAGPSHAAAVQAAQERLRRRSSGMAEFTRAIAGRESLCILDLGPTSPLNIAHLTDLGHKVYNEDVLLASMDSSLAVKDEEGKSHLDAARFLRENLVYGRELFDAVLCWDIPDYLHESLVKPMIERLHTSLKPGGVLLSFFHTRDAGPDAPYYRYHIVGADHLELQRGPRFRLQRVFNNRHIENLFRDYASVKFFLARDHIREVLVVR
jgi:SAM-dependent methyltransferase